MSADSLTETDIIYIVNINILGWASTPVSRYQPIRKLKMN